MIEIGASAPSFTLPCNDEKSITIPSGNPTILFFYPKDDTPGCTQEASDFSTCLQEFNALGVQIFGISPDSVRKHGNFINKHNLTVALAADEDKAVAQAFGVWVEKKNYGRTYMGIERSTFMLDEDGKVLEVWRKVKVKGHVEAVLTAAQQHFG